MDCFFKPRLQLRAFGNRMSISALQGDQFFLGGLNLLQFLRAILQRAVVGQKVYGIGGQRSAVGGLLCWAEYAEGGV